MNYSKVILLMPFLALSACSNNSERSSVGPGRKPQQQVAAECTGTAAADLKSLTDLVDQYRALPKEGQSPNLSSDSTQHLITKLDESCTALQKDASAGPCSTTLSGASETTDTVSFAQTCMSAHNDAEQIRKGQIPSQTVALPVLKATQAPQASGAPDAGPQAAESAVPSPEPAGPNADTIPVPPIPPKVIPPLAATGTRGAAPKAIVLPRPGQPAVVPPPAPAQVAAAEPALLATAPVRAHAPTVSPEKVKPPVLIPAHHNPAAAASETTSQPVVQREITPLPTLKQKHATAASTRLATTQTEPLQPTVAHTAPAQVDGQIAGQAKTLASLGATHLGLTVSSVGLLRSMSGDNGVQGAKFVIVDGKAVDYAQFMKTADAGNTPQVYCQIGDYTHTLRTAREGDQMNVNELSEGEGYLGGKKTRSAILVIEPSRLILVCDRIGNAPVRLIDVNKSLGTAGKLVAR